MVFYLKEMIYSLYKNKHPEWEPYVNRVTTSGEREVGHEQRDQQKGILAMVLGSLITKIERRNAMKYSTIKMVNTVWFVAVISFVTLSGSLHVYAEEKGARLAELIQGSWNLVSIYNEQDGKKTDVFGPNPRGSLILTSGGRFSYVLMRASLPKFASNARLKGTTEENQTVVEGTLAYIGTYSMANNKEITLHVEGCTFPNWDGQDQKRLVTVNGDELKMVNPTPSIGGGTNYILLKREQ
jgi:hypothetical protein